MGRFLDLALLLFSLQSSVLGQLDIVPDEAVEAPAKSANLNVAVHASFPNAEIFGVKLVNGKPTDTLISISNEEPEPITVQFVGGSLWTPDFDPSGSRIVRNLTTRQYSIEVPAGEKQTLPFSFQTNMHPQELRLNLAAVISQENTFFTFQAYNGTVAIVDPDSSIFDPQIIFLYLFLLACVIGVGYAFYTIWLAPYFPQKKKGPGGSRRTPQVKQPVTPGGAIDDRDGAAVTTGSKGYNEEWIPAHHTQRPEARRVKSGARPKSRTGKD